MLVLSIVGSAQAAPAVGQNLTARLDSTFAPLWRTDGAGCAIGVRHGPEEYRRAYGMANLEYGVVLTPESILESGSVAKQFTAAAVVLLSLEGKLALDDDVRRYVPEVPEFGETITLRHLLSHTSGLRDQWGLLNIAGSPPGSAVHTIDHILRLVQAQRMLNFSPGAEYLYSNTGYVLLAVVVARVSGQSFATFTTDRFFTPLGMTHTQWREDYRTTVPARATAYARQGESWILDMPFTMVHGNGGLLTTVGNLLIWNEALTRESIAGGGELVRLLETTGRLNDGTPIEYALGVSVSSFRGVRQISHSGSTAGYRTYLARWPDADLSVAVLCNAANASPAQLARRIASAVIGEGTPPVSPAPQVPMTSAEMVKLAGTYRDSTTDDLVRFTVRGDTLQLGVGRSSQPLTPIGDGRFWSAVAGEYQFEQVDGHWRVRRSTNGLRIFEPYHPADISKVVLTDYLGLYRSAELDLTIEVRQEGRTLRLFGPSTPLPALIPAYEDGFRAGGITVRFMRARNGRVIGLRFFAGRVRDLRFDRLRD